MKDMTKSEKIFYIFLILLAVFIFGVQVGITHGRDLQKQEYIYDYTVSN